MTPSGRASHSANLLHGLAAGGLTGVADAVIGMGRSDLAIPAGSAVVLLAFSCVEASLVGGVCGVAAGATLAWLRGRIQPARVRALLARPIALALMLVALAGAAVGAVAWGYARGIQVDAIDYRPLGLLAVAASMFTLLSVYLRPGPRAARRLAAGLAAFSIGVLGACVPLLGRHEGVLEVLGSETAALGPLLGAMRLPFDGDRDGFATTLCRADCDCDDLDPGINPGAVDIPDNGVDEDCSGDDLKRSRIISTEPAGGSQEPTARTTAEGTVFKPPYNIVLITIDACRADHLRMYGYHRETTPYLDRFAAGSVLFEQVRAQGPSTRHSMPSILTGRCFDSLDLEKGAKWSRLLDANQTFAEHLGKAGYFTAAMMPYFRFKERSGFQQGFDLFEISLDSERNPVWDPTADLVTDWGLERLDELVGKKEPWLIWLHYFDPHGAYLVHSDQASFGDTPADRYDGELLFVDRQVERFLGGLEEKGLFEQAAIIVTSDHGEALDTESDHGQRFHGFTLFDSEVRVPLMIRLPGVEPRSVKRSVGVMDVMPTILDLAGIPARDDLHGVSLVPYLKGENPARPPLLLQLPLEESPIEALVDWPYKLIWKVRSKRYSLYDLEQDPGEQRDISAEAPDVTERLSAKLGLVRYEMNR